MTEKEFRTASSIPVKPFYGPIDLQEKGFDYWSQLGDPGFYPFVRGISPDMYRKDLWIMGQYSGFGNAEESNRRYKHLISQGATGISIALDLPTQVGYDSDHPLARGEVGKVGVAINSLKDMEILFDGIPLNKLRQIRTTANSIGPIFVAFFLALAEMKGVSPLDFSLLLRNDILKEYVARGTYIFPPKPSLRLCTDVIEYCTNNMPGWVPINFCGYHMREAGCTAVQEIAFTFSNATAYMEEAKSRHVELDRLAPKLTCFFSAGMDLFEEVAKFRAARRIWANLMRDRFALKDPRCCALRIFCYTAGSSLTAQQPLNNIARVTLESLAAVLSGVQILATSSYDEAYSTPSQEAATVALRTQQIIAHESGVINNCDPLGGSYYVEDLTCEIEKRSLLLLDKINEMGGATAAIEKGYFQNEIYKEAYRHQKEIEKKDRILIGANAHHSDEVASIRVAETDSKTEKDQVERLHRLKGERDTAKAKEALSLLKKAAIESENVIPAMCDAVKAYVTIGEICQSLKDIFGEYKSSSVGTL